MSGTAYDWSKKPDFPTSQWSPICSPWSDVKTTKVRDHSPASFSALKSRPKLSSTSVIKP